VLALNKIDLVKREQLLPLAGELSQLCDFERVFMISSTAGDGTADLGDFLAGAVPEAPWLYPEDQLTDLPQRLLAAEITREQIYLQLHQELPYAAAVETEQWEERQDGSVKISQVIHIQREGQKAIVLGKGGAQVKKIGAASRAELEKLLERRVHLFLFVRVTPEWADDRERFQAMGLDYPE